MAVSNDEFLNTFTRGITPREERVLGCEYEALAISTVTGKSVTYDGSAGINQLLQSLADGHGWSPKFENNALVALTRERQSITLEPGGQVEMSGAPLRELAEVDAELQRHLAELATLEAEFPVRFDFRGMNPHQSVAEVQWMPKERYVVMRNYLPTRGQYGHYMMGLTCTVQANLDFTSEPDFAFKLKLANGIASLVNALFANSPVYNGKPTGYLSYRAHIWTSVDPERCWLHRFVFDTDCSFQDYVDWALDIPMFIIERHGKVVDIAGQVTFRELNKGKLDGYGATVQDWELHLSTLFPEARARPHLEMRSADVVPPEAIVACPALWKGLLYDDDCAQAAWDLVKKFSFNQRLELHEDVARNALEARRPDGAGNVGDLCNELVSIGSEGLARQAAEGLGQDSDVQFLNPLKRIVASGKTYAQRFLAGELK